jgi:hypothetical protein
MTTCGLLNDPALANAISRCIDVTTFLQTPSSFSDVLDDDDDDVNDGIDKVGKLETIA